MHVQIVLNLADANAANQSRVIATLEQHGLTITKTFSNYLVIDAQGPTATVESLFHTAIHDTTQGKYGERYYPATPVTIPTAIAGIVHGVLLDNIITMKSL